MKDVVQDGEEDASASQDVDGEGNVVGGVEGRRRRAEEKEEGYDDGGEGEEGVDG